MGMKKPRCVCIVVLFCSDNKVLTNVFQGLSINERRIHDIIDGVECPFILSIGDRNILPVERTDRAECALILKHNIISQTVDPIFQIRRVHKISPFSLRSSSVSSRTGRSTTAPSFQTISCACSPCLPYGWCFAFPWSLLEICLIHLPVES